MGVSVVRECDPDIGRCFGSRVVGFCRSIGSWRGSELPIQVIIGSRLAALTLNVAGLVLSARKGLVTIWRGTPQIESTRQYSLLSVADKIRATVVLNTGVPMVKVLFV